FRIKSGAASPPAGFPELSQAKLVGAARPGLMECRRTLHLAEYGIYPVLLIVYDGQRENAYWLDVQRYFSEHQTAELFGAGETIHAGIPTRNRLNRRVIRKLARYKNSVCRQVREKGPRHV